MEKRLCLSLKKKYYDLILMDIKMPVMDGKETSRKIRKSKSLNNIVPIIALTGTSGKKEDIEIYDSGINGIIKKPFKREHLISQILKYQNSGNN